MQYFVTSVHRFAVWSVADAGIYPLAISLLVAFTVTAILCISVIVVIYLKCPHHCVVDLLTYEKEKKLLLKCKEMEGHSFDPQKYFKQRHEQLLQELPMERERDIAPLQLLMWRYHMQHIVQSHVDG